MNITNNQVDPFLESITIASLCHHIYRKMILKPDTISIIPELGYNPEQVVSKKALQWLKFTSNKNNLSIQHAKNGGEYRVGDYLLDCLKKQKQFSNFRNAFGTAA